MLEAGSRFHPLYGDGLSNHLPMALLALDGLGASPAQLQRFAAHYSPRLCPRGSAHSALQSPLHPDDAFGRREAFEGVYGYFIEATGQLGVDAVLHTWVPRLLPGVSASAFHALIRLAYALEAQHPAEIAAGLAYWVIEYRVLGELAAHSDADLEHIAARAATAVRGQSWLGRLIIDQMVDVAAHPALRLLPSQPDRIDARSIASFALDQYAAREDFTLLHLVTGCHAFGLLAPYAGEPERAARYLWQAVLFAFLTTLRGEAAPARAPCPDVEWQPCLQVAAASLDDHVIKLVYTAWREFARTLDARYRHIAARKAGLPTPCVTKAPTHEA